MTDIRSLFSSSCYGRRRWDGLFGVHEDFWSRRPVYSAKFPRTTTQGGADLWLVWLSSLDAAI